MRALARTLAAALPCARRAAAQFAAPAVASLSNPQNRTSIALAAAGALAAAAACAALVDSSRMRRRMAAAECDVRQLRAQVNYVHACMSAQRGPGGWRVDPRGALPSPSRTRIYIN
jgi:hypothetical protein